VKSVRTYRSTVGNIDKEENVALAAACVDDMLLQALF